MRILVVGSGGREHALAWACGARGDVEIFCAPGNGGTASLGENIAIDSTDAAGIAALASARRIDLVVVGPDAALAAGVVDACRRAGVAAFGPTASAARLETSKAFAKDVMREAGIATAAYAVATPTERSAAVAFIREHRGHCVVKADGLALGKGVIVCSTEDGAMAALGVCLDERRFGNSGARVVVEERLSGPEVSVFAISDGINARLLPPACDYKRAYDGDAGPNTGGMGAYAPPQGVDVDALLADTLDAVILPTLEVMRSRGEPFRGCLYTGLMLTPAGPRVLEFNARFGDPETQALMPLIDEDVAALLLGSARDGLTPGLVRTHPGVSVCVVATTEEYPESAALGSSITLPHDMDPAAFVFHAGTAVADGGGTVVNGGRVINVVGRGPDVESARRLAYATIAGVDFAGVRYRHDIAGLAGNHLGGAS